MNPKASPKVEVLNNLKPQHDTLNTPLLTAESTSRSACEITTLQWTARHTVLMLRAKLISRVTMKLRLLMKKLQSSQQVALRKAPLNLSGTLHLI